MVSEYFQYLGSVEIFIKCDVCGFTADRLILETARHFGLISSLSTFFYSSHKSNNLQEILETQPQLKVNIRSYYAVLNFGEFQLHKDPFS